MGAEFSEESGLDLLKTFGISQDESNEDDTDEEDIQGEEDEDKESLDEDENENEDEESEEGAKKDGKEKMQTKGKTKESLNPKFNNQKQANAFAQMRYENSQKTKLLNSIADVLGVKGVKNDAELVQAVQQAVIKAQSQQQGVPEELLSKLQRLEEESNAIKQARMQEVALQGLQTIKDEFELTDEELAEFAKELDADGINPFVQDVDLKKEYVARHYLELLTKAKDSGSDEEAKRSAKTKKSATVTSKRGASEDDEGVKIKTSADLAALLNKMPK